jgi:nicotinamide-nucleotide amidase
VAESCTGGLVAKLVTDVPGASDVFAEGVVTYANEAKVARLGVPADLIVAHGAVSEPVARAMAEGERAASGTTYALATTGIAGPAGGSEAKPVGLVFIALAGPEGTEVVRAVMPGDRDRVRHRAALAALNLLRLRLLRRS